MSAPSDGGAGATAGGRAGRELRAVGVVDAPVDAVWTVLSDLRRMGEWSPELVVMRPLLPGGLRVGQQYVGLNRRRAVVWPTRSVVSVLEPGRALGWDTRSSGARWIWELEPLERAEGADRTRVVHRRPVPTSLTVLSRVVAPLLLGGSEEHADELEAGMARSVQRLGDAVLAAR